MKTPLDGIYRGRAQVLELFNAVRGSFGVALPFGAVMEIVDGLAVRHRFWLDRSSALEAAGLRG